MGRRGTIACQLFALALAVASPRGASAEDAMDVFHSLYGAKLKEVAGTVDKADDLALAKEMLGVAKTSTQTPDLLALLCDASYDLALKHADGFSTAAEAMTLLAESVESKKGEAHKRLIDVLAKQSRVGKAEDRDAAGEKLIECIQAIGDEKAAAKKWSEAIAEYRRALTIAMQKKSPQVNWVKEKLDGATNRERAEREVVRLQERLLKDAADFSAAEELVRLMIFELDNPQLAQKFLDRCKDEKLKSAAPLLVKPVEAISESECLMLGEWHKTMARDAKGATARAILERGSLYLQRYIALHGASDLSGKKAELFLKEMQGDLAKHVAAPTSTASKPRLPVDPDAWGVRGRINGRWTDLPLSKMESSATSDGLTAKNTTRMDDHAHLYFKLRMEGDFDCEIEVEGLWSHVGITATDGTDKGIAVMWRARADGRMDRKVRIQRKGEELEFHIDGMPADPFKVSNPSNQLPGYLHFRIDNNETIQIRRFTVKTAKK